MRLSTTSLGAVAAGLLVAVSLLAGLNAAGAQARDGRGQAPAAQVSLPAPARAPGEAAGLKVAPTRTGAGRVPHTLRPTGRAADGRSL
jgi:hypothetical protein